MGFLSRLFAGSRAESRGAGVASRMDALAQFDPAWSSEAVRRRVRDAFFAVQRSWIERAPEVGEPFMTERMASRQRLRIEGLVRQHRVHQLENPLIEDMDFVAIDETADPPTVTARLVISMVETILDSRTRVMVVGVAGRSRTRVEYWTFERGGGDWRLADVEQEDEGGRHVAAPLVGDEYAELSAEMLLRERYAREEITIDEFEAEMARLLVRDPTY